MKKACARKQCVAFIKPRSHHEKKARLSTPSDGHEIALYDGLHNTRKTVGTFVISH